MTVDLNTMLYAGFFVTPESKEDLEVALHVLYIFAIP